jgi:inorganic pyrophosphatase
MSTIKGDPLGIYVLNEVPISLSDILTEVRIVGGLQIEDGFRKKYIKFKIIAVLKDDATWSSVRDLKELPEKLIE